MEKPIAYNDVGLILSRQTKERKQTMLYAEWEGKRVTLYNENRVRWRIINVDHNVVGVQVSPGGADDNDSTVAIAQDNGRTSLYRATGQIIRR